MANTFTRKDYGTWDVWRTSHTHAELQTRRAKLAKTANTRLLRLERATSEITGKTFNTQGQFDVVNEYLTSQNKKRFSESKTKSMNDYDLKREITILEQFLAMKTSTVGGSRRAEASTIETFVDKYGIPREVATSPEFYEFLNSETFHDLVESTLASESIFEIIEQAFDEGNTITDILSKFEKYKSRDESGIWKAFGFRPI